MSHKRVKREPNQDGVGAAAVLDIIMTRTKVALFSELIPLINLNPMSLLTMLRLGNQRSLNLVISF